MIMSSGEYLAGWAFAERFRGLIEKQPDPAARLIADRMVGSVRLYMGDQADARRHIERMLSRYVDPLHRSHMIRFVWDQRVAGEIILAVVLWLQGFPGQAVGTVQKTIERARASDHAISLCYKLARASCPVALRVSDLAAAERYVSMLLDHSAKLAMAVWSGRPRAAVSRECCRSSATGTTLDCGFSALLWTSFARPAPSCVIRDFSAR